MRYERIVDAGSTSHSLEPDFTYQMQTDLAM
jgi:hypothetical protein